MPLKPDILKTWPPGGWQFHQPETNWTAPDPMHNTYHQQVLNIQKMRQNNPQAHLKTDYLSCAYDMSEFMCKLLKNHPKWCIQLGSGAGEAAKKAISPSLVKPEARAGGAAAVKPAALFEWLGEGGVPVARELAEKRAEVCAVCPKNSGSPNCPTHERMGWIDWMTAGLAKTLRGYLSLKNQMQLKTSKDDVLDKCLACRCELKLKVWVGLDHIRSNASLDDMQKLDSRCWVLHE